MLSQSENPAQCIDNRQRLSADLHYTVFPCIAVSGNISFPQIDSFHLDASVPRSLRLLRVKCPVGLFPISGHSPLCVALFYVPLTLSILMALQLNATLYYPLLRPFSVLFLVFLLYFIIDSFSNCSIPQFKKVKADEHFPLSPALYDRLMCIREHSASADHPSAFLFFLSPIIMSSRLGGSYRSLRPPPSPYDSAPHVWR